MTEPSRAPREPISVLYPTCGRPDFLVRSISELLENGVLPADGEIFHRPAPLHLGQQHGEDHRYRNREPPVRRPVSRSTDV